MTKRNRMSRIGLSSAEEARAGTQSEAKRRRYKKGGAVKPKTKPKETKIVWGNPTGPVDKPKPKPGKPKPPKMAAQHGGMVQGYDARKDEQLGMTRGPERDKDMSMAARRNVARATRKPRGTYGFKKGGGIGMGQALRGGGAVRKS
jgi:hypothetical protein